MEPTIRSVKDNLYGVYVRLHPLRERLLALQEEAPSYKAKEYIASAAGSLLTAIDELAIVIHRLEIQLGEEKS